MQQEWEHTLYPLTPPEDLEEMHEVVKLQEVIEVDVLVYDLEELILKWRDLCSAQRKSLSKPHKSGDLPVEYRSGMAQGLEDAAADLERALAHARRTTPTTE
jgi:hypothetical protein